MRASHPGVWRLLARGWRRRCPRCGNGRLFAGWYTLNDQCPTCGLIFKHADDNTWAFMYMSTAFLTGVVLVVMLVLTPPSVWMARALVLPAALLLIAGSLPYRKGVAIALEYIVSTRWADRQSHEPPGPPSPEEDSTDPGATMIHESYERTGRSTGA